jgi:hypothetical protein
VIADVVGIVTGVSAAVTIDVKGRPVSKRTLRLTDTRFNSFDIVVLSCITGHGAKSFFLAGTQRPSLYGVIMLKQLIQRH